MSISPDSSVHPPVHIDTITHRGKEVCLVIFSFSKVLYHRCKKIHGHYSQTHKRYLKYKTLLMLIYSCGLRIGETFALKPVDISEEGLIDIRGGKGQKDRRIPLSTRVLKKLRQYYKSYKPSGYLFKVQSGGQYSNRSAAKVLKRTVKKAGISKKVTLHTLRYSYAIYVTNQDLKMQYIHEVLGHKSPKTKMNYTHLSGKDIRKIRSPIDDMDV